MTKKRIYISLVLASVLVLAIWLIGIATLNRGEFIEYILSRLRRPYLSTVLKERLITVNHFGTIRLLIYFALMIAVIAGALLIRYQSTVLSFIEKAGISLRFFCSSLFRVLKSGSRLEKTVLSLVVFLTLVRWLYYAINTNLQYDEIWYYNYYTSRPLLLNLFTFSTYPLHQLLTHFYQWMPFGAKINLRLPGLVAGMASFFLLYGCIRRIIGNFIIAIGTAAFFVSLPYCTANMVIAKGVMEEVFFAALAFFSLAFYTRSGAKKYIYLFALAQAAGIYAAPTHAVFLILLLPAWIFYLRNRKVYMIKPLLLASLFAMLISLLAYAPMAASGYFAVAEGSGMKTEGSMHDLLIVTSLYYGDSRYALAGLMILAALFLPYRCGLSHPRILLWLLALLLSLSPLIIFSLLGINLHPRAYGYIVLVPATCMFLILYGLTKRTPGAIPALTALLFFVGACIASHLNKFRSWSGEADAKAVTISKLFMQNGVSECYDNAPNSSFHYFYPALEFYYAQEDKTINLKVADPKSQRHEIFNPGKMYPCIIDSMNAPNKDYINRYVVIYRDSVENIEVLRLK